MIMNNILDSVKNHTIFQGGANYEDFQIAMFFKVLETIKYKPPVMVELGSNDCFYSILFNNFF